MSQFAFQFALRCCCLCSIVLTGLGTTVFAVDKPNVLMVLVDDLKPTIGCYGDLQARTPNIDALARRGVRFENAFVTNSLCSPSRASFLTGVYSHVHGVAGNLSDIDYEKAPLVSQILEKSGYSSGFFGKWHMGSSPEARPGYDAWFAVAGQGRYTNPVFFNGDKHETIEGYHTDIITERAVQFIREHASKPFFAQISYKAVHSPLKSAPRHKGSLDPESFNIRRQNAAGSFAKLRRARSEALLSVDDSVGQIVDVLEELGLDNTLIVFTSDNGFMLDEHGFGGKRVFYDESIRIPWIVAHPDIRQPGSVRSEHVLNIDLLPSILEHAGVEVPEHVQGRSFLPLLRHEEDDPIEWRDHWVYEYFNEVQFIHVPTHLAVIDDDFKYVWFPEGPSLLRRFTDEHLLFDRRSDPYELSNIASLSDYDAEIKLKREQLRSFMRSDDFRFFDLDPKAVNERMNELMSKKSSSRVLEEIRTLYPDGYTGWEPPDRKSL